MDFRRNNISNTPYLRPWSLRALWKPLGFCLLLALFLVSLSYYHPNIVDQFFQSPPQTDNHQSINTNESPLSNQPIIQRKEEPKRGSFTPPAVTSPNGPFCYEWIPANQSFQPKLIQSDLPIFNKERGLLPGESGGKHVKENTTIFSPYNPHFRSNWTYTATEGQDLLVLEILNNKRNGIFVDVGARYWHKGSNSFALEYYHNWKGICIEADSHFYVGLVLNRTCSVVCNNPIDEIENRKVKFHYQINGFVKKPGNDNEVKYTVTLEKIFQHFNMSSNIDYLSLDIEGHEYEALKTINFTNYNISVISVERPTELFHKKLIQYDYWWLTHLPGNFGENIYIHSSIPNFENIMNKYRPNAKYSWRGVTASYLITPRWKNDVTRMMTGLRSRLP